MAGSQITVIGGGPAGLMAAEQIAAAGCRVQVIERMPSVGRKFLLAGRGGLNLTHSEDLNRFLDRYGSARDWLAPAIAAFPPEALRAWADALGQETFVGSSGRVFPRAFKASPLLRAWLGRLAGLGVTIRTRTLWRGWTPDGALRLVRPDGLEATERPAAVVLALGGGSWPRLGSDGAWVEVLDKAGVATAPLVASNCGFQRAWSALFCARFQGIPLKPVRLTVGAQSVRGEAMITATGIEGGAVYALSGPLREALAISGSARLDVDLRPDVSDSALAQRLAKVPAKQSLSTRLRKGGLAPVAIGLLREVWGADLPRDADALARAIKTAPLMLTGAQPIDRAISSAGGVIRTSVDARAMLKARPGVFVAGEMLDWDAPTGGYLLQASFATGVAAAQGVLAWLGGPAQLKTTASNTAA